MDNSLLQQRAELKGQLAQGKYQTLTDTLLDGTGRILQRIFRTARPVPFWVSAVSIALLMLLVSVDVSLAAGERHVFTSKNVVIGILGVALGLASLIIFKTYLRAFFSSLQNDILDSITSDSGLAGLQRWLGYLCNLRLHLAFCVVYGLSMGIFITVTWSDTLGGEFIGFGPAILTCLVGLTWAIPMYLLLVFLFLPGALGRCTYTLFKADPGNSEVIARLSGMMKKLVYLYALVAAGSMVFIAYAGFLVPAMVLLTILVAWLPITLLFVSGQTSLTAIIRRAKWQTLNEVQVQIAHIQAAENLAEKESMDKVNRLLDYHQRVMSTRNSTLNLQAGLGFFNSLLLPVLGFILGNYDKFQDIASLKEWLSALFG